jgi:hypothetical protein
MLAAWLLLLLQRVLRRFKLQWGAVLQGLVLLLAGEGCPLEAQVGQVGLAAAEGCRQCGSCTRIQPAAVAATRQTGVSGTKM